MFKSKKNKINKIIEKLHKETTAEVLTNSGELCNASIKTFTCTRPKGHSGYHIASTPGYFIAIWYHMLSDTKEEYKRIENFFLKGK